MKLVSVILTNYKRSDEAVRAFESISAQDYDEIEIVVVLDYPNREFCSFLSSVDCRFPIKIVSTSSPSSGLAAARNCGVSNSTGDYLAFIDDDDVWDRRKISFQSRRYRETASDVVSCGIRRHIGGGRETKISAVVRGSVRSYIQNCSGILRTVPSSIFISREYFYSIGGFDEDLVTGIDHDFWFKLAEADAVVDFVEKALVEEHVSGDIDTKMTTRIFERISGLEVFCDKWKPRFENLYGSIFSQEYFDKYKSIVLIELFLRTYRDMPEDSIKLFRNELGKVGLRHGLVANMKVRVIFLIGRRLSTFVQDVVRRIKNVVFI
ncbi:glycosyltransferase [Puniceicoccus vermicola]|uniref:Glycosyltransferase family 2 protein n=1 Tax=Puniceicoccus vermicola TaxID=388746 RepID=A0A7X1E3L6_9BACT|nr:glycosyltransferase family 2 protein [Puniceicoccus vermicola]